MTETNDPLFAGLFWKRATTQGALVAITLGLVSWIFLEATYAETDFWPPQLAGLLFSVLGMVVGSLLPQFVRSRAEIIGATPANA